MLHGGELLLEQPLQPAVEVDLGGVPLAEGRDGGARGVLQLVGPVGPRQPVLLDERAPGGERREAVALAVAELDERPLPPAGQAQVEDEPQGLLLGGPRGVAVDPVDRVQRARLGSQGRHPAVRRVLEPGQLGHVLDPQVERVDEAPGGRQVRRGLHRRDRLGGVQRVDQHEVGVVRGRGPGREVGEVAEVADAPRLGRAHLVQLRHQADDPPLGHRGRQREALRGHDEGGLHRAGVDRGHVEVGHEAVPPQRAGHRAPRRSPPPPGGRRPRGRAPTGRPAAPRARCRPRARRRAGCRCPPARARTPTASTPRGRPRWRAGCGATGRARRRRAPARPRRHPRPRCPAP